MATILNTQEDEKNKQLTGQPQTGGGASTSSAPSSSTQPQRQGSGTGPNIQRYLQANVGGGQKLAQGIQQQAQQQASKIGQNVQQAKKSLEQASQPLEQELGEQGQQLIQTAFKDPQALLKNQQQLQQFQNLKNQASNIQQIAPVEPQQQIQSQLGNLGQQAQAAGTETGRFQLLQQTFGKPTYNRGQQRLDQLLLQAQPNVAGSLQKNLASSQQQAQQQVQGLDAATQAKIQALQQLSGQRAQEIEQGLTGGQEQIAKSAQQRLAEAQSQVSRLPDLQYRLQTGQLTQRDLDELGLQAGQKTLDVDLSKFITQQERQPTLANVADPNEVARYRALQQLSGGEQPDIFGGEQQLGGFKPYEYDVKGLQEAIGQRQRSLQSQTNEGINQLLKQYYPLEAAIGGYIGNDKSKNPALAKLIALPEDQRTPENIRSLLNEAEKHHQMLLKSAQISGIMSRGIDPNLLKKDYFGELKKQLGTRSLLEGQQLVPREKEVGRANVTK